MESALNLNTDVASVYGDGGDDGDGCDVDQHGGTEERLSQCHIASFDG